MPKFKTKHPDRERMFPFTFDGGYFENQNAAMLGRSQLSVCDNFRYVVGFDHDGNKKIGVRLRQGTTKITNTAVASGETVVACTKYKAQDQYIICTYDDSTYRVYYLDSSLDPVFCGSCDAKPTFSEFQGVLLIHDTGALKTWDGTTFTTLSASTLTYTDEQTAGDAGGGSYTDEVIATTAQGGAGENITGTLSNTPITASSVTITYWRRLTPYQQQTVTDDGAGNLVGDVDAGGTNTINYTTGAIDFDTSVDTRNNMPVEVDYTQTAETEITGTLTHTTVKESTVSITYDSAGTTKTVTDDGVGRLTGHVHADYVKTITNCADNGSGLIRVTANGHGFSTDDEINIQGVTGTTEANNTLSNPTWAITKIDANTFDLQGSTFANAYTANGTASKNTVIYTTGAYVFKPGSNITAHSTISAEYSQTGGSVPNSTHGLVRDSRLVMWGDSNYTSRSWYSGVNDKQNWSGDAASDGGYEDCNIDDGYALMSVIDFVQYMLFLKENGMHRLNNFPTAASMDFDPIRGTKGCIAKNTALYEGGLLTFLSQSGWVAYAPGEEFGDLVEKPMLSNVFDKTATEYADSNAMACYNGVDEQLWLALYDSSESDYTNYIHAYDLRTGLVSRYRFAHGHDCFAYVDNEMLIGAGRNLYKLVDDESTFEDNDESYASYSTIRTGFVDWGLPQNRKINKKLYLRLTSGAAGTCDIKIYKDKSYTAWKTLDDETITANKDISLTERFTYFSVMIEITDITPTAGTSPIEIGGIELTTAIGGRLGGV